MNFVVVFGTIFRDYQLDDKEVMSSYRLNLNKSVKRQCVGSLAISCGLAVHCHSSVRRNPPITVGSGSMTNVSNDHDVRDSQDVMYSSVVELGGIRLKSNKTRCTPFGIVVKVPADS